MLQAVRGVCGWPVVNNMASPTITFWTKFIKTFRHNVPMKDARRMRSLKHFVSPQNWESNRFRESESGRPDLAMCPWENRAKCIKPTPVDSQYEFMNTFYSDPFYDETEILVVCTFKSSGECEGRVQYTNILSSETAKTHNVLSMY